LRAGRKFDKPWCATAEPAFAATTAATVVVIWCAEHSAWPNTVFCMDGHLRRQKLVARDGKSRGRFNVVLRISKVAICDSSQSGELAV
jgi:hypothetical protein